MKPNDSRAKYYYATEDFSFVGVDNVCDGISKLNVNSTDPCETKDEKPTEQQQPPDSRSAENGVSFSVQEKTPGREPAGRDGFLRDMQLERRKKRRVFETHRTSL